MAVITAQNFLEPFIIVLREGTIADPYVDIEETIILVQQEEFNADVKAIAVLRELPLQTQGVIATINGTQLIEIQDSLTQPDATHFKVDYTNGRAYFDNQYMGEQITFSYKGRGSIYVSADRVLLNLGIDANYIYTLSKFVQEQLSEMNVGDLNDLLTNDKSKVVAAINEVWQMITDHSARTDNPHGVTKTQVGLGNCDNTSDANKPVSIAQKTYIDAGDTENANNLTNHTSRTDNPHGVTKSQVGLGNCDNTSDTNKPVSAIQKTYIDNADNNLQQQLDALVGVYIYIGHIYKTTAELTNIGGQELLDARALELKPDYDTPQLGWVLVDDNNSDWYYNGDEWIDLETDVIGHANNENYGIVKGDGINVSIADGILTILKSLDSDKLNGQEASYYATSSEVDLKADKNNVLEKNNTETYVPTSSYNPATKKYVDDKVQSGTSWGGIGGDISDQSDLSNALLNKQDKSTAWNTTNLIADTIQPDAPTSGYILWVDTNE